jgi:serine acetyltransferase
VKACLANDHARLLAYLSTFPENAPRRAYTHPSFVCVFLYRVANYLFRRRRRHLARLVWHLNFLLTGADISPSSDLGPGLVVVNPAGLSLMGKAGRNFTVMPCSGIGSEVGRRDDMGAGPGLPVLGDDVVLEPFCGVLGPVRVGSGVRVRTGTCVVGDVPDNCELSGPQARIMRRREL